MNDKQPKKNKKVKIEAWAIIHDESVILTKEGIVWWYNPQPMKNKLLKILVCIALPLGAVAFTFGMLFLGH